MKKFKITILLGIIFLLLIDCFPVTKVSAASYSLCWPVPKSAATIGTYSSGFGPRVSPTTGASTNHRGIDIPVKSGTEVYAAYDGTVVVVGNSSARGNYVVLYHPAIDLSTLYQHLTKSTVSKGDSVSGGSKIAVSGNTGVGTGAHLHFGVMKGKATKADNDQPSYGMAINPLSSDITYHYSGTSDYPIDIGTNFYGCIVNPSTGYRLTNSNTNVTLNSADNVMSQVWKFERQSDTSYRICSLADGTFLDAQDAKYADNTNVQTYVEHDTAAQRWYFCDKQNGQYSIRSCLGNAMIDVHTSGGVIDNGANVQLYHPTGASEQIYKVQKIDDINSFLSVNVGDGFYGSLVNPSTGYRMMNAGNNAVISSSENKASQIWRFERQTDNSYRIISIADNTQLDAHDSSTDDGNNIQTYTQHNGATQRWYFYKVSNNRYMLRSSLGMAVMDIHTNAGNVENGANLQLYHITGSSEQIYSIQKIDDVCKYLASDIGTDFYAYIVNTDSGLRLTNSNNNVTINSSNNNSNQIWKFEKQPDNSYLIRSAYNDLCLDADNGSCNDATNLQIYEDNGTKAQRWYLYQNQSNQYTISSALGNAAVDIHTSGGSIENGANVQLYHNTGANEQRYTIQTISNVNQIISADLGTNFYAYITNQSTGYKMTNVNDNVAVNSSNNSPQQIWKFEKQSDNRYLIRSAWNNKCLDAQGGQSAANTNVQVYQDNGQTPQRWYLCPKPGNTYTIKTALGETVVDTHTNGAGAPIENGANVQLYKAHGTAGQWYMIDKITTKAISSCTITIVPTSYDYDGTAKQPSVTVKDGSTTLTNGTHYSVSYSGNTNAGTGTVTITGIGYYTGSTTRSFTLNSKSISNCTVTINPTSYSYDGTAKQPTVTVKDGATTLTNGTQYTVEYTNNVNAGNATVTVKGKGNYKDSETKSFTINPKSISSSQLILERNYFVYDGTPKMPDVSVIDGSNTLSANTDYNIAYEKNASIGIAKVIISGKNNYSESTETTFEIISHTSIGDANLDSRINIRDVTAIQRHIAETEKLSSKAITVADVNRDGEVTIDDATFLQQKLAEFVVLNFTPKAISGAFTARIIHNHSKNAIVAVDKGDGMGINVETGVVEDVDSQIWKFYLQPDNSYKIVNKQFEKCMDLCGGVTEIKANIQLLDSNGQDSQCWFLKECGDCFKLIPKCATMNALDVQGGLLTPGTNVFSFVENESVAQLLTIQVLEENG